MVGCLVETKSVEVVVFVLGLKLLQLMILNVVEGMGPYIHISSLSSDLFPPAVSKFDNAYTLRICISQCSRKCGEFVG